MKKKIKIIIILVILFIVICNNLVFAKGTKLKTWTFDPDAWVRFDASGSDVLVEYLQQIDPSVEAVYTEMVLNTQVTMTLDGDIWKIKIGNIDYGTRYLNYDLAVEDYAFPYDESEFNKEYYSWNAKVKVSFPPTTKTPIPYENFCNAVSWGTQASENIVDYFNWSITSDSGDYKFELYIDGFFNPGENVESNGQEIIMPHKNSTMKDLENAKEMIDTYSDWMKKFGEDTGGTIAKAIIDVFKFIADIFQSVIDKVQTLLDGIPGMDFSLTYTYNELNQKPSSSTDKDKVDYTVLNKYTKVGNYQTSTTTDKNVKDIDNKIDKFSTNTKIPVIPIDIYAIAYEKVDLFSVDFMNIYRKNNASTIWNFLRDAFSTITHIVMYISTAVLLSTLIYHAINIIRSRNDNPENRVTHIQGIYRFMTSLVILIVVILIMALSTTLSHYLMEIIKGDNINASDELPIRINVDKVYSFSTNITGYFRFMAESQDVSRRAISTIEYIAMVAINVVISFFMLYRMIKMWILGIIGPTIAAINALNLQERVRFKLTLNDWAKSYVKLASIQIIAIVIYTLIEYSIMN